MNYKWNGKYNIKTKLTEREKKNLILLDKIYDFIP